MRLLPHRRPPRRACVGPRRSRRRADLRVQHARRRAVPRGHAHASHEGAHDHANPPRPRRPRAAPLARRPCGLHAVQRRLRHPPRRHAVERRGHGRLPRLREHHRLPSQPQPTPRPHLAPHFSRRAIPMPATLRPASSLTSTSPTPPASAATPATSSPTAPTAPSFPASRCRRARGSRCRNCARFSPSVSSCAAPPPCRSPASASRTMAWTRISSRSSRDPSSAPSQTTPRESGTSAPS